MNTCIKKSFSLQFFLFLISYFLFLISYFNTSSLTTLATLATILFVKMPIRYHLPKWEHFILLWGSFFLKSNPKVLFFNLTIHSQQLRHIRRLNLIGLFIIFVKNRDFHADIKYYIKRNERCSG